MKKSVFAVIMISVLSSCSKTSSNTDNTVGWVGTYSTGTFTHSDPLNTVIISKVDNNTVQMQLKADSASVLIYPITTFQKAIVVNTTTLVVNENGTIDGISDTTFHFTASASLSGNNIILSGAGTSTSNVNDVKNFYYSGNK